MPQILSNLLNSEKFIYVALLWMLPITVFAAMGSISIDEWRHDALWGIGILVGGKSLQGGLAALGGSKPAEADKVDAAKKNKVRE